MSKSDLLLESMKRFYSVPEHAQVLVDILQHKSGISLRNLEHFVTNYAKQTNLSYTIGGKLFTVHVAYKSSLDGYSKKLFDPFCRTERITMDVLGSEIVTTVAQLNFIRWCIVNDIILQLGSKGQNNTKSSNGYSIHTNMDKLINAQSSMVNS